MSVYRRVRRFISTNGQPYLSNWYVPAIIIGAFVIIIAGRALFAGLSGDEASSQSDISDEGRQLSLLRTEVETASGENTYMVLDFVEGQMLIKQHGVTVWNAPLRTSAEDSLALQDFAAKLTYDFTTPVRHIHRTHLFRSSPVVSDTVLAIVGDALKMTPDKLKRYIPERLSVCWGEGLCLDIRTDTPGEPNSVPENIEESIREHLGDWLGGAIVPIRLTGNQAMALYGACKPGMITLIKT